MNTSSPAGRPSSLRKWWHSLPEHRQDRLASIGPLLSVLLFGLAVLAAMGYLRLQEVTAMRQSLQHDSEYAHQFLCARLNRQREGLLQVAQQLALHPDTDARAFKQVAQKASAGLPELTGLMWLDASGRILASYPMEANVMVAGQQVVRALSPAELALLTRVRQGTRPAYGVMPSTRAPPRTMLGPLV